jgi:hypothetical protein
LRLLRLAAEGMAEAFTVWRWRCRAELRRGILDAFVTNGARARQSY